MAELSYKELLENLFDGVYYADKDRRILFWNKSAERITGYERKEVVGQICADAILRHVDHSGNELCENNCPLALTLQDGKNHEASVFLHHKMGYRVPVSVRVSAVFGDKGDVIGAIEVFSENTVQMQAVEEYARLKEEVLVDEMTRVGNRKFGITALSTRLYEWQTFRVPFGLIMLDIDDFKLVNERYGKEIGDDVLVMISRTVVNVLRKQDSVARWTGDQFIVITPNVSEGALEMVAERLRLFISKSFLVVNGEELVVKASLGATMALESDEVEKIFKRADQLMTLSKKAGGDRVTMG